jgi:hypothetical protein
VEEFIERDVGGWPLHARRAYASGRRTAAVSRRGQGDYDKILLVQRAVRRTLERSNDFVLSQGRRRVFNCVLVKVSTWTRLWDEVSTEEIAECSRCSGTWTRECLNWLADRELVLWIGRPGPGSLGILGLLTEEGESPIEAAENRQPNRQLNRHPQELAVSERSPSFRREEGTRERPLTEEERSHPALPRDQRADGPRRAKDPERELQDEGETSDERFLAALPLDRFTEGGAR